MKLFLLSALVFLSLLNQSFGQSNEEINTIRQPDELSWIFDVKQLSKDKILIQHSNFEELDLNFYVYNYKDTASVIVNYKVEVNKDFERVVALKIIDVENDNVFTTLNFGLKDEKTTIFVAEINLAEQKAVILSSEVLNTSGYLYTSDLSMCSGRYYFYFTEEFFKPSLQGLASISRSGNLKIVKTLDSVGLYLQRYIPDAICISENRFIIGGSNAIATVIDSSMSTLHRIGLNELNSPNPLGYYRMDNHYFAKDNLGTVLLSGEGVVPFGKPFHTRNWTASLNVTEDSIVVDNVLLLSNEDSTKADGNTSICFSDYNNSFYIATYQAGSVQTTPKIGVGYNNEDFSKKFYLRKITDNQEAWTRTYGGDANYNIVNLRALDNGYIVIFGHVYNYYGERTTNGFFMIVNEEGELITSSIDIEALDNQVSIYPNPANDLITIDSPEKLTQLRSFDNQGRLLREDIQLQNNQLDISAWSAGIYYLQLFYGGEMVSKRLVKN